MTGDRERALKRTRNDAIDDEASLHRSLHIVGVFLEVHKDNPDAQKLLAELTRNMIAVRTRARARHQDAEQELIERRNGDEILAQSL
jgi:hypothetical protein